MTSHTVTLYKLFLGDQDSTTRHYRRGYTIHSISVFDYPNGAAFSFGLLGHHSVASRTVLTNYTVEKGDVILDSFDDYWLIKDVQRYNNGDKFGFFMCSVEEMANFPFNAGFFGFEDEDHGTIGCGFEDGFERGFWAL